MQIMQYQEETIKFKMQVKELERVAAESEKESKARLDEVKKTADSTMKT